MRDALVLYECALCHTFLGNYTKATLHLGIKHSEALRINGISKTEKNGDFIKFKEFPEPTISLQRLRLDEVKKIRKETPTSKTPVLKKSKPKAKRTQNRLEIKLDTLKAGEIETLITDLFKQNNTPASTSSTSGLEIRRSNRKVKEHFKSYGELDSDDEEIIRTGSGKGLVQKKFRKDPNYEDGDIGDVEDDEDYDEDEDPGLSRKSATTSSKVRWIVTKPYYCRICQVQFDGRSLFHEHMTKDHLKDGTYTCNYCEKNFFPLSYFNEHMRTHVDPIFKRPKKNRKNRWIVTKPYYCRICQAQFDGSSSFHEHMTKDHLKDGTYTCNYCEKNYFPLSYFNRHMRSHVDPIFKRHKKIKKNYKTEECKICGKLLKWLYGDAMADHMKVHAKVSAEDPSKPHVCPVCHYRFGNKSKLQRHFILHLENNPFKCEFLGCGKKFNSNYHLNRHIALHTDRIIHQCNFCDAKFSRKERLQNHLAEFHSENSTKVYKGRSIKNRIKSIHELAPTNKIGKSRKHQLDDEDELRFDLESVHLADRIIITEDQDIHIKGEKLSPQKRQSRSSTPASRSRSTSPTVKTKNDQHESKGSKVPETSIGLLNIIRSDPVVKRIQETNPESLKEVIGSKYTYNKNTLKGDFKCQICSWTGIYAYNFTKHMQDIHGAQPNQISSSEKSTVDNPLVLELTCGSCGYRADSADNLSTHISEVHVQKNKFPCSFCSTRFLNISRRKEHERRVHLNENKFNCTKCDAKFSGSRGLRKHLLHKHDPEYQKMLKTTCKCKICGRVLASKRTYRVHLRLHTNPETDRRSCKICGQNCATKFVLRRHIKYVHVGVTNPYNVKRKAVVASRLAKTTTIPSEGHITENPQSIRTEEGNPDASQSATYAANGTHGTEILGF